MEKKKGALCYSIILVCLGFVSFLPQHAVANFYVIPVGRPHINPSDVVELYAQLPRGETKEFRQRYPDGTLSSQSFVVPTGKVLVVTAIHLNPLTVYFKDDEIRIVLKQGYRTRLDCAAPQSQPTFIQFPSGLIIAPGSLSVYNSNLTNARTTNVYVYGYLTTDR